MSRVSPACEQLELIDVSPELHTAPVIDTFVAALDQLFTFTSALTLIEYQDRWWQAVALAENLTAPQEEKAKRLLEEARQLPKKLARAKRIQADQCQHLQSDMLIYAENLWLDRNQVLLDEAVAVSPENEYFGDILGDHRSYEIYEDMTIRQIMVAKGIPSKPTRVELFMQSTLENANAKAD